jgi:ribosome assembly protein 4
MDVIINSMCRCLCMAVISILDPLPVQDGKMVRTLRGHGHWVNTLALSSEFVLRTGPFDHHGRAPADLQAAKEARTVCTAAVSPSLTASHATHGQFCAMTNQGGKMQIGSQPGKRVHQPRVQIGNDPARRLRGRGTIKRWQGAQSG